MKILFETLKHGVREIEVNYLITNSGHGHKKVTCEVEIKIEVKPPTNFSYVKKEFTHITNDMPWVDSLSEFKYEINPSCDEINEFFYKRFESEFDERILNWLEEVLFCEAIGIHFKTHKHEKHND